MTTLRSLRTAVAVIGIALAARTASAQVTESDTAVSEILLYFSAADGTPLEAKLSLPRHATGPVPVVFYLHGAGPRDADNWVRYRAADGTVRQVSYYGWHAAQLAKSGVAFFRMNKRGCTTDSTGRPVIDRAVFSTATPSVLLSDYQRALAALRMRPEIDPGRIVFFGASEGTRLAPRLAGLAPDGVVGLVLTSYAGDNSRTTVAWQNTIGPWRTTRRLVPGATETELTRAAYDSAVAKTPGLDRRLPFEVIDLDKDGRLTPAELASLVKPRLDAINKAVETRDDDFLWANLLNLTSGYLRDDWDGPPTQEWLRPLAVPIGIFHGELDGTTRVEAVEETRAALAATHPGLTIHLYPGQDHDLGWTPAEVERGGPQALVDALRYASELARAP